MLRRFCSRHTESGHLGADCYHFAASIVNDDWFLAILSWTVFASHFCRLIGEALQHFASSACSRTLFLPAKMCRAERLYCQRRCYMIRAGRRAIAPFHRWMSDLFDIDWHK